MKNLISYFLVAFLLISCDSFHLEKRRYMKGFYFSHSRPNNDRSSNTTADTKKRENDAQAQTETDADQNTTKKPDVEKGLNSRPIPHSEKMPNQVNKRHPSTPAVSLQKTTYTTPKTLQKAKPAAPKNDINWGWFAMFAGMMGATFAGVYRYNKGGLMNAQKWAFKNKFKAQSLMVVAKAALMITGFWLGVKLFEHDYLFPALSSFAFSAAFVLGILAYPFRKRNLQNGFSFLRKKISGLVLSISGLLLCMNLGNHVAYENANGINKERHINKRCANYFESKKDANGKPASPLHFLKNPDDSAETKALKVALSVLVILSIIVLEIVVLAYGCLLACDGAEGASVALIVGGTLVLAAMSILTLYWISRIKLKSDGQQL